MIWIHLLILLWMFRTDGGRVVLGQRLKALRLPKGAEIWGFLCAHMHPGRAQLSEVVPGQPCLHINAGVPLLRTLKQGRAPVRSLPLQPKRKGIFTQFGAPPCYKFPQRLQIVGKYVGLCRGVKIDSGSWFLPSLQSAVEFQS